MAGGGGVPTDRDTRHARSEVGNAAKRHGIDSSEYRESKRKLDALVSAARAEALVASWPELSSERLDRIAGLLRAGGRKT